MVSFKLQPLKPMKKQNPVALEMEAVWVPHLVSSWWRENFFSLISSKNWMAVVQHILWYYRLS